MNVDLNHIWHPVEEQPKGHDWYIALYNEYGLLWAMPKARLRACYNSNWDFLIRGEKVLKWTYVKDLLPQNI